MFEKFNEQARQVCVIAQEYARKYQHVNIEPGDILMGLMSVGPTIAASVLDADASHVERDAMVSAVDYKRADEPVVGQIPFAPDTTKTLEFALREALSLGHNEVAPHHLLLGLVRNRDVAERLNLDPDETRAAVIAKLMGQPSSRHLIEWPDAVQVACRAFLEAAEVVMDILEADAIPVFKLASSVDEVSVSAQAFREEIVKTVLPAWKREI